MGGWILLGFLVLFCRCLVWRFRYVCISLVGVFFIGLPVDWFWTGSGFLWVIFFSFSVFLICLMWELEMGGL